MANIPNESFGRWLLKQSDSDPWTGHLARSAKGDIHFPKEGTPDDVRARLRELMSDGDMFEAVDDAETDWVGDGTKWQRQAGLLSGMRGRPDDDDEYKPKGWTLA